MSPKLLARLGKKLTLVEGSESFCNALKQIYPYADIHHSLFEKFQPDKKFDNIILGHVLEHVDNPVVILKYVKEWLSRNGRIMAAVPNSLSLHRQAAVIMGLLSFEEDLSELDHHHGHQRVYNPLSFRSDFLQAGLKIDCFGGYWIKPVSNKQISETWNEAMLNEFMKLGERYPDIGGEIYIVASV